MTVSSIVVCKILFLYVHRGFVDNINFSVGQNSFINIGRHISFYQIFCIVEISVKTPIEETVQPVIAGKKLAVVPVLRAGLGMVNGILALVPTAKVGHIGLYRDPVTHEPHEYYCKLPEKIDQRQIVVVDPMLATGGSAVAAVDYIKQHGGKRIKFMSIIAAPEGVSELMKAHPDIQLYVGCLDRCLNKDAYICPGLGDAGDRIFGTL